VLKTLRETRNAVYYVLFNHQKHTGVKTAYIDEYSSLGSIRDLQRLATAAGIGVILRKIQSEIWVDPPLGWMIQQVVPQLLGKPS
jgi:hypothetical protein